MRDVFAGVAALVLLFVAASLGSTLSAYRRRRQRARDSERALGRTIIVEIPGGSDLVLFSEDAVRFHYGERAIDKDLIVAVRLLVNGAPITEARRRKDNNIAPDRPPASYEPEQGADVRVAVPGVPAAPAAPAAPIGDPSAEGIARDRWDVQIEAVNGMTLVECGAIRERVSQELARAVFDAVKRELDGRIGPPLTTRLTTGLTTPPRGRRRDD